MIWRLRCYENGAELTVEALEDVYATTKRLAIKNGMHLFQRYDDALHIIQQIFDEGVVERVDYTFTLDEVEVAVQ